MFDFFCHSLVWVLLRLLWAWLCWYMGGAPLRWFSVQINSYYAVVTSQFLYLYYIFYVRCFKIDFSNFVYYYFLNYINYNICFKERGTSGQATLLFYGRFESGLNFMLFGLRFYILFSVICLVLGSPSILCFPSSLSCFFAYLLGWDNDFGHLLLDVVAL